MRGHRRAIATLLSATLLFSAGVGRGGNFRVTPVRVTLTPSEPNAVLTVENSDPETLRVELSGFLWEDGGSGEPKLTPTSDIIFYPAILQLKSGESRKIRIGSNAPAGPVERTYRLMIDELPPLQSSQAASSVRMRLKLNVPVFVQPAAAKAVAKVEGVTLKDGKLRFTAKNDGNAHFLAGKFRIIARGQRGQSLAAMEAAGGYVLAGGTRAVEVPFDKKACAGLSSVLIEMDTDSSTIPVRTSLDNATCS